MKTNYIKLIYVTSATFLCLFLTLQAIAQHGGSRTTSGGGGSTASSSQPSVSSGGGSRSTGSSPTFSSPSNSNQRTAVSPPRSSGGQQGVVNRQGAGVVGLRNYGYAPRQGGNNYSISGRAGINNSVSRQGITSVRGNIRENKFGYVPRTSGLGTRTTAVSGGGVGYRTSPPIGYGLSSSYWGNQGYNHYNHGYYDSYYLPRLGYSCDYLPFGYYPFYYGDFQYYYSDGLYYGYANEQYTVVEPPVGAEVQSLPAKAQSIVINGQQYYELNGVYYQAVTKDDGTVVYQIAGKDGELNTNSNIQDDQQNQGPQMGDIVNQLPQDCRKIKVNGEKLFVSPDGVYYQVLVDVEGNRTYKVVGIPADGPEQN